MDTGLQALRDVLGSPEGTIDLLAGTAAREIRRMRAELAGAGATPETALAFALDVRRALDLPGNASNGDVCRTAQFFRETAAFREVEIIAAHDILDFHRRDDRIGGIRVRVRALVDECKRVTGERDDLRAQLARLSALSALPSEPDPDVRLSGEREAIGHLLDVIEAGATNEGDTILVSVVKAIRALVGVSP